MTESTAAAMEVTVGDSNEQLVLTSGKSMVLKTAEPIKRVSLSNEGSADILVLSPTQLYLTGKELGSTNLTLWSKGDKVIGVYDLLIVPDMTGIKKALHQLLPKETSIMVTKVNDWVTLSGTVSNSDNLDTALSVAESFAPEKVNNFMTVGGLQQVMLEVRVAEMSRDLLRNLGINFNYIFDEATSLIDGHNVYSFLDNLTGFDTQGRFLLSSSTNYAANIPMGDGTLGLYFNALKENGLAKILAEPNLICISGQEANFLAGGEIPIPAPQGLGTVAIEFKKFGVGLTFKPLVLDDERIHMRVEPEVSELDFANAVVISGFTIPAFRVRRVSTSLELNSGQSFAIAGLIQDNLREAMRRVPFVGDVPVLGSLFRSSDFQRSESELVIIVTPRLVKPLDMAKQRLPTDGFEEPSDFEFYLLGRLQSGRSRSAAMAQAAPVAAPSGAGFDGPFGHTVPQTNYPADSGATQ